MVRLPTKPYCSIQNGNFLLLNYSKHFSNRLHEANKSFYEENQFIKNFKQFFMKRIFTFLLALFFLSLGRVFSQADSCVILGCAANYGTQTTNNSLPLLSNGFPGTCYNPPATYSQVFWQFVFVDPSAVGVYAQSFTATNGTIPLDLDWAVYDMGATAPGTITCSYINTNKPSWTQIRCSGAGNNPAGPGTLDGAQTLPPGATGEYYAIAIIINPNGADPSPDPNFTFTVGTPTLDGNPLTVANCAAILLPVKLTGFNARVANCGVVNLDWTAADESDFKSYEVQSSTNGASFQTIATLEAKNSGSTQQYSYQDNSPAQGKLYYRLRLVNTDGSFEYSKTIAMRLDCNKSQIFVYPNPVKNKLNVNITNAQNNITIAKLFDNYGRVVYTGTMVSGTNTIDMSKFASGIYILSLKNNTQVQNIKITR